MDSSASDAVTTSSSPGTEAFYPTLLKRSLSWSMQHSISDFIVRYMYGVLIVVGTCGNSLTILVTRSRKFGSGNYSLLLSAIAVADTGVLLTELLKNWLAIVNYEGLMRLLRSSAVSCHVLYIFSFFFKHLAAGFLMLFTVERAICISLPLKGKQLCTSRRIRACLGFLVVWAFAVNIYILVHVHRILTPYKVICEKAAIWKTLEVVDACLSSFIPSLIIFLSNCVVIVKLVISQRGLQVSQSRNAASTASTLLVVSFVYLFLTLPRSVYHICRAHGLWNVDLSKQSEYDKYFLIYTCVTFFYYCNNAINFFLYCLSGSKFRKTLLELIRGPLNWKRKTSMKDKTVSTVTTSI
jgi:hypothetical protein